MLKKVTTWFKHWISVTIGGLAIRMVYFTNRYHVTGAHNYQDLLAEGKSVIVAIWHGRLLAPFMFMAGNNYYGLAGTHKDAELISQIGNKIGWNFVRGSSSEKGREAYQNILRKLKIPGTLIYMTPDGPKGPPKQSKPGAIRAAQALDIAIIPATSHSTRFRGFTNWDTFVVAKAFARTEIIYGQPLYFDRAMTFEDCAAVLDSELNKLEQEADARTGN